ncbi:hypothetical protein R1flu_026430 [Riccia fluitans]|uniref:Uncharacterized protein n=1 Tax=Riccia fluitans TaxID=41844 RepID=A0ABD1XFX9_9MARC
MLDHACLTRPYSILYRCVGSVKNMVSDGWQKVGNATTAAAGRHFCFLEKKPPLNEPAQCRRILELRAGGDGGGISLSNEDVGGCSVVMAIYRLEGFLW